MKDRTKKSGAFAAWITAGTVLFMLLFFIAALVTWTLGYWHDITFDEIVFYLGSPLEGTAGNVIGAFILKVVMPTVLAAVIFAFLSVVLQKKKMEKACGMIASILIFSALTVSAVQLIRADKRYGILRYIRAQNTTSEFVDNYYVAPSKDNVSFPEKKRNLICIYLESMETTFADKAHGGDFEKSVIPELTELALNEGECFEGSREKLNGGHVITGATYTMSGIVAQTAGIPIARGKTNAGTTYADKFYPGVRALGDILKDEGYEQAFMCGSPVAFGSREVYLRTHGCEDFFDYDFAAANGYITKGYKVWWGFEDSRLFDFAKEKASAMASSGKPFALTILTADTHFEDGYVCGYCKDEFDTQYSNVMACSSRQVSEFVKWIKQQDFYKDTTIILSGDHTTMDADYCNGVDPSYQRRTYVNVMNPAVKPVNDRHREYTTFDLFPTTLASLGVKINGNRLGLGTDLFSDSPTLYERFGREVLEEELTRDSRFFREIARIDPLGKSILENLKYLEMKSSYTDQGTLEVSFWGIERAGLVIEKVRGEFFDASGSSASSCEFVLEPDKTWKGEFETGLAYRDVFAGRIRLTATDSNGEEHVFFENADGRSILRSDDLPSYLESVSKLNNISVLIAAKGNASSGLSRKTADLFKHIGLECTAFASSQRSYLGAAGTGFLYEKSGDNMLIFNGMFKDGKKFEIASSDLLGSIVVDGKEYSPGEKGFNIVIYDELNGKVIDRASYDLLPEQGTYELSAETVKTGIRFDPDKKTVDLWITPNIPDAFAGRELHVYMFTWDKDHPKQFKRTMLSRGKFMTHRDGSNVPYYFVKVFDVSGYDVSSFGMMFFFVDDSDGVAVWKDKTVADLGSEIYKNPQMPSNITFREE